jgi:hypothetical protein
MYQCKASKAFATLHWKYAGSLLRLQVAVSGLELERTRQFEGLTQVRSGMNLIRSRGRACCRRRDVRSEGADQGLAGHQVTCSTGQSGGRIESWTADVRPVAPRRSRPPRRQDLAAAALIWLSRVASIAAASREGSTAPRKMKSPTISAGVPWMRS